MSWSELHFIFGAVPDIKYSCLTGDWNIESFASNFNSFAQENGIPYIDLKTKFKNEHLKEDLFFKHDIHCTEFGHEIIAEELIKYLK